VGQGALMPTRALITSYAEDLRLFPDAWHKVALAALAVVLVAFPLLASDHWLAVGNDALIAVVGAAAMMILTGFAGQVSLGHAAFIGLGAYTAAILGNAFGVPFWMTIPLAGLVAALVGLAVGPFALRLEGLYLAIVTVGLLFLVEHMLRNGLDHHFGKDYLNVPMHAWFVTPDPNDLGSFREPLTIGSLVIRPAHKLYVLFVILAVGTVWVGKNIARSNVGRAMMAVRDRDLAASALGVDQAKTKLISFGVSSFFAGVAGAMYAFAHPVLTLEPFSLHMSVEYVAMVVLGGIGTMFGAVAGALTYVVLSPVAEMIGSVLPFGAGFSSEHRAVLLFFPALCLFLVFEPLGLLGIWLRLQRYFLAWPFRY